MQPLPRGVVRFQWSPEIFSIVDPAKSHVEASGRDGGVVPIAFVFQNAERDFSNTEIRGPENGRTDPRSFLHRIRRPANPFPLLFVSGTTKVFIFFEPA